MKNLKWKGKTLAKPGTNIAALIPKKAQETLELRKGMKYTLEITEDNEITLYFRDKKHK